MTEVIRKAIKAGIPIFIGYFPSAIAFGVLAKGYGVGLLETFLFSAVVFAGASQFIALNLLVSGVGYAGIILTTLLVNFRHFLMSAYLSRRLGALDRKYKFLIAFGVTDEVFSVLSFTQGKLPGTFVFILQLSAYSGWVSGTLAGYVLGGFLPQVLTKSMGIALYSLLLAVLLPEIKKSVRILLLTISSGVLNAVLIKMNILPDGWTIIVCIVVIALAGAFLTGDNFGEGADG